MSKIAILRHHEIKYPTYNELLLMNEFPDIPLTPHGMQARHGIPRMLEHLWPFTLIVSPRLRARQTAGPTASFFKVYPIIFQGVSSLNFSNCQHLAEVIKAWKNGGPHWHEAWINKASCFESSSLFLERNFECFKAAADAIEGNILFVGHMETIWAADYYAGDVPLDKVIEKEYAFGELVEYEKKVFTKAA